MAADLSGSQSEARDLPEADSVLGTAGEGGLGKHWQVFQWAGEVATFELDPCGLPEGAPAGMIALEQFAEVAFLIAQTHRIPYEIASVLFLASAKLPDRSILISSAASRFVTSQAAYVFIGLRLQLIWVSEPSTKKAEAQPTERPTNCRALRLKDSFS